MPPVSLNALLATLEPMELVLPALSSVPLTSRLALMGLLVFSAVLQDIKPIVQALAVI